MLEIFAIAGGLFALLTFVHFFADWLFQSHKEATNKHHDFSIRGRHCIIYTAAFVPFIILLGIGGWYLLVSILTLFLSHFIIDTYIPVYLWAKFVRKVPELSEIPGPMKDRYLLSKKAFAQLFKESPVHAILFIAVDQILHLGFLWVIVIFALL